MNAFLFERFEFKGRERDLLLQFVNRNALEDGRELDKLELLAVAGNRSVVNVFLFRVSGVGTGRNKKERCLTIDRSFWTGRF